MKIFAKKIWIKNIKYIFWNKYIDQILVIENKENIYRSRINHSIANIAQKMDECEINHLNILLFGLSGIGKSNLINSMMKLGNE